MMDIDECEVFRWNVFVLNPQLKLLNSHFCGDRNGINFDSFEYCFTVIGLTSVILL